MSKDKVMAPSPTSPALLTRGMAQAALADVIAMQAHTGATSGPHTVEALRAIASGSAVVAPALPDGEPDKNLGGSRSSLDQNLPPLSVEASEAEHRAFEAQRQHDASARASYSDTVPSTKEEKP